MSYEPNSFILADLFKLLIKKKDEYYILFTFNKSYIWKIYIIIILIKLLKNIKFLLNLKFNVLKYTILI